MSYFEKNGFEDIAIISSIVKYNVFKSSDNIFISSVTTSTSFWFPRYEVTTYRDNIIVMDTNIAGYTHLRLCSRFIHIDLNCSVTLVGLNSLVVSLVL